MGFLSTFIQGLSAKTIGVLLVVLALGGWGVWKTHQVNKTENDLNIAISQRNEAAEARDKALAANAASEKTIKDLQKEKADIQRALNDLAADRQRSQKALNDLTAAINAQRDAPENKVGLSPVLKFTIDSIQKKREGAAK